MFENEQIRKIARAVNEKILVKEIWILIIMLATYAIQIATKNSIGVIVNFVFTIAAVVVQLFFCKIIKPRLLFSVS